MCVVHCVALRGMRVRGWEGEGRESGGEGTTCN
jgi:hypothetical protein